MTAECRHPRTGLVSSRPLGGIEGEYAAAPVCSDAACIAEAREWVSARVNGRPSYYVADEVSVS